VLDPGGYAEKQRHFRERRRGRAHQQHPSSAARCSWATSSERPDRDRGGSEPRQRRGGRRVLCLCQWRSAGERRPPPPT
jgi:hypothetical protein